MQFTFVLSFLIVLLPVCLSLGLQNGLPIPDDGKDGMVKHAKRASSTSPRVFLLGDSTMSDCRTYPLGGFTSGWGTMLESFLSIGVLNYAKSGYSARMMSREGYFDTVLKMVQSGDFVIMELGRNDLTPVNADVDGKSPCPPINGNYGTTCSRTFKGKEETVYTFTKYMEDAARKYKAKGAHVIISSLTSTNSYMKGTFTPESNVFVEYARQAAIGAQVDYVAHHEVMTDLWRRIGKDKVMESYPPNQWTHLTRQGAIYAAAAFVSALEASSSPLKNFISNPRPSHFKKANCPSK